MGECGCNETRGIARIPAPGEGKWYVLEIYPGCRDCGTDWALAVVVEDENDDFTWILDDTPVAEFGPHDMWGTPILCTKTLRERFMEDMGYDDEFAPEPFALEEFIRQGGLIDVFWETRRDHDSEPPDVPGGER